MENTLPNSYLRLSWLGSTGTQYIDTGYKPNGNTEIDILWFWNTDGTTQSRAMFGVDARWHIDSFSQYCDRLFCYGDMVYRADGSGATGTAGNNYYYYYQSGLHHFTFKEYTLNLDDTIQFNIQPQTFQSSYNLWLFAHNRGGHKESTGGMDKIKFYSCKIWEKDILTGDHILKRDFIPCLQLETSKPGVYDLVTNTFYTNQNTGGDFVYEISSYKSYIKTASDNVVDNNYLNIINTSTIEYKNYKTIIHR